MDPVDQVVELVAWWEVGLALFVAAHLVAREVAWGAEVLMNSILERVERKR